MGWARFEPTQEKKRSDFSSHKTGASLLKKRVRWPAKRRTRKRKKMENALFFGRFVAKEEGKVAG